MKLYIYMKAIHMGISHLFHWHVCQTCPILPDSAESVYMYKGGTYGSKSSMLLRHDLSILRC